MVDFGASDAALDDETLKEMPALVQIPESAGPVCITYTLEQLKEPLKLSAKTLSGIYLGTIKNWQDAAWQDAAIKNDNPGVNLPKQGIVVVYRTDGSGTTNIFTTYLAAVSPEWKSQVGQGLSVSWPIGIGGKGSEGVTGVVKQSAGAIGYVELSLRREESRSSRAGPELGGQIREFDGCGNKCRHRRVFQRAVKRRTHANRECSGVGARCLSHQWPYLPACAKTSENRG